jgi:tetratricopeptide (TPR) repeat protein
MDEQVYSFLKYTAVGLAVVTLGWVLYDSFVAERHTGDTAYYTANKFFEDGAYDRALEEYDNALRQSPDSLYALRGRARTLMQLGRDDEALADFNRAIERDPSFAGSYANRGILYDRMGKYHKAIADYDKALALDPKLAEGPDWLTRFLRLQPQKPPTIADRARYLREQLAKPESERTLRIPKEDAQQRPYKL